jgi:aldehyde:ferredoxin oxidoreductase
MYGGIRSNHAVDMISLCTGWNMDLKEALRIGERTNNIKRLINLSLGINKKEDTLPKRVISLSLKEGGTEGHLPDQERMIEDYYRSRGWSKDGRPSKEKFDELGIADALDDKYRGLLA